MYIKRQKVNLNRNFLNLKKHKNKKNRQNNQGIANVKFYDLFVYFDFELLYNLSQHGREQTF